MITGYSAVPLVALIGYLLLITIVLRVPRTRTRQLLLVYLAASSAWGLSSFMLHTNYFPGHLSLWEKLLPVTILWAVVSYCHVICALTQRRVGMWVVLGYAFIAGVAALAALGYAPQIFQSTGGAEASSYYWLWLCLTFAGGALFTGLSIFYLVQSCRASRNPQSRNKVLYLLIGGSLLVVSSLRIAISPIMEYPLEHIGLLCNALLITYVTLRHKLLDIKLALRNGLVYSSVSVLVTTLYVLMLWSLQHFFHDWTTPASIASILVMTFVMAWLFNTLRGPAHRAVDKVLYGKRSHYRQMVLSSAPRLSSILDLGKLAEAMLKPIPKALDATQASLLLSSNGDFTSQFAKRLVEEQPVKPMSLSKDSQVVRWLANSDKPLSQELIDLAPEFKRLSKEERDIIQGAEIELLFPIKSNGKLVGILALSKKRSGSLYPSDDIDLLIELVSEAAVAIENASRYDRARNRAQIDELTGLLNHRCFHERLDQEISRCSRFGDIFSLIFVDLDLFKTYNDVYGHLAGDEILRQTAQYITSSIRAIDMAFRYGGDEFTIILPQAPLDDAYGIADRIRKRIESEMDSKEASLTCSLGIASWPTDGVMREEIVQAADAALYFSKQAGRNRVWVASDTNNLQVPGMILKGRGEQEVLSTVHALAATVDAKDPYTYGHSKKTAQYAVDIAEALGYSEDKVATLKAAALLHDIGKIRVSDRLLAKRGALSDDDWDPIRAHPELGVAILKHVKPLHGCMAAIQYHHEHYDGSGYPSGLAAQNIPLDARILAIADAYDAMTSSRPYREKKLTHPEAMSELKCCAGTQFDPEIVRVFAALWEPLDAEETPAGGLGRLTHARQRRGKHPPPPIETGDLLGVG